MLTVDITSFSSGVYHVERTPSPEAVDLDPEQFHDLHVLVRLDCHRDRHHDRILATVDVQGAATLTCDRTLRAYDEALAGTHTILFGPADQVGTESDAFDEVRPLDPGAREIDLTDIVRDTLLLAIPQRKVAPGAEEEDIPMTFGGDGEAAGGESQDIDPRWEALRKLRDEGEAST